MATNNTSTYVLGVSFDYHDSSATILKNGKIVAAIQEERLTRNKNTADYPEKAIEFCLKKANISINELDQVVYYEKALWKFERIIKSSIKTFPKSSSYFRKVFKNWINNEKFNPLNKIHRRLGIPKDKISSIEHHQSHAASAFYSSSFDEAVVLTIDGVGEEQTLTISHGKGSSLNTVAETVLPHSLGLFYSAFTAFLGFRVNEDEYKVMGMSGYGKPIFKDKMFSLFSFSEKGSFHLDQRLFNFLTPTSLPYTQQMIEEYGTPRVPESDFDDSEKSRHYANIAASVQACTEEVLVEIAKRAKNYLRLDAICLAGGVALNGLANKRIRREVSQNLYVQPASGDSGTSMGAAQFYYYHVLNQNRTEGLNSVYLGPSYSDEEIENTLKQTSTFNYKYYSDKKEVYEVIAQHLADGNVIGWLQGKSEFGPRALGARSILANPLLPEMQATVNAKVKFRELFRPFAPAVIEKEAAEYFDIDPIDDSTDPQCFMLTVCNVNEGYKTKLPAITHTDGTARVQVVKPDNESAFYNLLEAFGKKTGMSVLLNTSFNLRGEPIVESPQDALKTFDWCDIDVLCCENFIIKKNQ